LRFPKYRICTSIKPALSSAIGKLFAGDTVGAPDVTVPTQNSRKSKKSWRFSGIRILSSALEILGSPDDFNFRSCLTLFCEAGSDKSDRSLFGEALKQFYDGEPDPRTLDLLQYE